MNTYGYSKLSIKELGDDLTPKTGSELIVIEGEKKKGATTTFDLTGLTKEPVKVFGSNIEYFLARKGTGSVAANFGLLDVPAAVEKTILGLVTLAEGIDGFGEKTEPPYVAAVAEAEDLYGEPVAFAMVAGSFNRDAFSLATKNDEDFTPEPGEYVYNSISRKITIGENSETVKVLRAYGAAAVTQLKNAVLGTTTGGGQ